METTKQNIHVEINTHSHNEQSSLLKTLQIKVCVKACGISESCAKHLPDVIESRDGSKEVKIPGGSQAVSGLVVSVGDGVTRFSVGDRVAGILPITSPYSGCSEFCILSELDAVHLPDKVSYMLGAGGVYDGVCAYTALHYCGRLAAGETLLIADGAIGWRTLAVQLAQSWGCKVICSAATEEEKAFLEKLPKQIAHIVMVNKDNSLLVSSVMEETAGLGVDVLVDNGVEMFLPEEINSMQASGTSSTHNSSSPAVTNTGSSDSAAVAAITKHHVLSCLGVAARWVTAQYGLQLDPPDTELLYHKSATVSLYNPDTWTLCGARKGFLQHILHEVVDKLAKGQLRPNITNVINGLNDTTVDALNKLPSRKVGKTVIVTE